uniref:Uncharacterized protein n=1 Tax=Cacopsylla melanoneura TaxID=428564 RepID=A0A8D9B5W4_9HEMI
MVFENWRSGNSTNPTRAEPEAVPDSPRSPSYDDSYSEDTQSSEWSIGSKFIPSDNFGTNVACLVFSALSHYVYGIHFNAYESVNSKYDYPNIGSMSFVLATAFYLIWQDLSLRELLMGDRSWKYSIYKILAVTFLRHLILSGIWQQLVNLTWELTFIFKDFIDFLYDSTGNFVFSSISSSITMTTARWITYVEGLGILLFVLYSRNTSRSDY